LQNTLTRTIAALAVAGGLALSTTAALAGGSDTFNRPALGPTWIVTAGGLVIANHELVGTTNLSLGYLTLSSRDTAASAVVFLNGTGLQYGAVAVGNVAGGSNAFVKIQEQNGGGTFDHGAFYTGNNSGSVFFTLASPVPSPAILDVFFCGTIATMRITSAAGVQTYTNNYGNTFGPGAGLGTFGPSGLDNFIGYKTTCKGDLQALSAVDMPGDVDKSK
jgi:hypothetical protein